MPDTERPPSPELTIVTVAIAKHYDYIRRQAELIDALNPGITWRMIVVDNAELETPALTLPNPRCLVLPGVPPNPGLPRNCMGSYHHAAALNMAMKKVCTRMALVLDPDLFVVYRHWMRECLDHMRRRDLTLFGVPWHYRWYNKYRYHPCVHFALMDLERMPAAALDFTPDILDRKAPQLSPFRRWLEGFELSRSRWRIGSSGDTGWRMHHDFPKDGRADVVIPVVDIRRELMKPKHLTRHWGRMIERLLPNHMSFLPVRGSYAPPAHAPAFSHPNLRKLAPEAFVWRGAPFAFHLRRQVRDEVAGFGNSEPEEELLPPLLDCVAASPSWNAWAFPPLLPLEETNAMAPAVL